MNLTKILGQIETQTYLTSLQDAFRKDTQKFLKSVLTFHQEVKSRIENQLFQMKTKCEIFEKKVTISRKI